MFVTISFGEHERRYLSMELEPFLETLGGDIAPAADQGGRDPASAMAFTKRMEEVQTFLLCVAADGFFASIAVITDTAGMT